ncbi:uncharacterized protein LOC134206739 [Armigeres subalbatus]|uniref:uncharacterized protein LOC134206739 n=1 Tax=Armigeres subalbatus TaxID=124917 RepID=UPI002ED618C9
MAQRKVQQKVKETMLGAERLNVNKSSVRESFRYREASSRSRLDPPPGTMLSITQLIKSANEKGLKRKMYSPGKYVRAPPASSESDTDNVMEFSDLNGLYVRPRPDRHASCEEEVAGESDEFAHYSCVAPDPELELRERVKELENAIKELSKDRDGHHAILSKHHIGHHTESSPTIPYIAPLTPSEIAAEGTIRWDNITPFPKNVPATKMWEAWTCFIEDFEIASSLSNVRNPKRRVELLLLSMGEELKSVVRAAKLRPDPEEEGCYEIFVKNIDNYLKSMTDPAAEHESFSNMRQEEVACRNRHVNVVKDEELPRNTVDERSSEQQINALSLPDVLIDCRVGSSRPISFLIDSGADANVLGGTDWDNLKSQVDAGDVQLIPLKRPKCNLRAYASSNAMVVEFAFTATIEAIGCSKPTIPADFFVVRDGKRSLLGRTTASDMELLKVGQSINSCYSSIFPKMPGVKVKFSVDESISPVRNAYYNIPAAYRDGARQRLEEMETRGIIEKVSTATQWISGMSAVPKGNKDFRLVVNMRAPNKAIKREYFRMPSIDEMRIKLHGAKFFSKLELCNAFYHLELSEESRDLTTFLSENGMYRFTRLIFGVNCAPEIFQREMMRVLKDIKNKIVYIDDILLFADTIEELRKTVARVLQILRMNNLSLNTDKCEFDKTHLKFLGHELNETGFNIDENKVKDIQKFRQPTTASELRSFLGLASFVSPYIKDFAEISSPLWAVISSLNWTSGIRLIKDRIIHSTVSLGFFSQNDKTFLYTDASPRALGAVLVQQNQDGSNRIISFASKSLTPTEKKYAQNQREALSAVWAVEHFSYFLLGRHFVLRTDAQGMAFILRRTREESKRALTRADGWALRLSPYNYDIEYIRGHENIADPSSRLYEGEDEAFNEEVSPWEICPSPAFLTEEEIRESTKKDDVLLQWNINGFWNNLPNLELLTHDSPSWIIGLQEVNRIAHNSMDHALLQEV